MMAEWYWLIHPRSVIVMKSGMITTMGGIAMAPIMPASRIARPLKR